MARFPVYERSVGLSGGATASYASDSAFTAPARALQGLGNAMEGVGADFAQMAQKTQETKDDAWFSKARAETALDMDSSMRQAQQSATGDATGFTQQRTQELQAYRDKKLSEAPSDRARSMYTEWTDSFGVAVTKDAATFQATSDLAVRSSNLADAMNAHLQVVAADPGQYEAAHQRAMDDLAGAAQWMTPEQETEARTKIDEGLKLARAKSLALFNPEAFLAETGPAKTKIPAAKVSGDVQTRGQQALGYFMSQGYTKEQAAGIVGNLIAESKLNTGARNPGDGNDRTDSIGIGQWNSGRALALKSFAAANHADWRDFNVQLAFVDHELKTSESTAGSNLKNARTVDEATAAMAGFERPAGWSPENPRGAHNYKGRLGHAAAMAGLDGIEMDGPQQFAGNPNYAGLSPDAIFTLQNAAQQQLTTQKTAAYEAYKDAFSLDMAQGNILSADQILGSSLNDGDKASFLTKFNTDQSNQRDATAIMQGMSDGTLKLDPFDTKDKGRIDNAYDLTTRSDMFDKDHAAASLVKSYGIVPDGYLHALRGGLESRDPASVAAAAQKALRISQIDPNALSRREGGQAVQDAATAFQHYSRTLGLPDDKAAQRVIDLKDPDKIKATAALMDTKPVKDFITAQSSEANVRNIFDPGIAGFDPKLGNNPAQAAAMVGEYKSFLEESMIDAGGDQTLAKQYASERFQRIYSPSNMTLDGDGVVTRLPPEKTYPPGADGTWTYVMDQAHAALAAEGVVTDEIYLQPDAMTDADFLSGRQPRYQVFYMKDGKIEQYNLPFYALQEQQAGIPNSAIEASRAKRDANRALQQRLDTALPGAGMQNSPLMSTDPNAVR